MSMKLLFAVAGPALLLGTFNGAAAADVSGTWKIDGSVFGYAVKPTCTFKQDGTKLTGTCSGSPNDAPLTGETPDGKTVNWTYIADDKGDKHEMKFMGVLDSDKTMKGKFTADGHGGKFTAQEQ
jgi:hypothetical protein